MSYEISSPASDREVDVDDECQPVRGWNRLHSNPRYCVRLYEGQSFKPWVGVEKCTHCGAKPEEHR